MAWACYPPETQGQTERVLALLDRVAPALPARRPVLVQADADEPWLLVTNHPFVTAAEYGMRMWEELAFRDLKSGGWQWQRSRVRVPARAARLWLVLALASAWMVVCGLWVASFSSYCVGGTAPYLVPLA